VFLVVTSILFEVDTGITAVLLSPVALVAIPQPHPEKQAVRLIDSAHRFQHFFGFAGKDDFTTPQLSPNGPSTAQCCAIVDKRPTHSPLKS
jgi:hypothetical protein